MSSLLYSIFISINFFVVILAKEHVPVLLWSSTLTVPDVPSLKHLGSVGFNELVQDAVVPTQPLVVVFLEQNLSNEDFLIQSTGGRNVYKDLEAVVSNDKSIYLPSVVNPMKTFKLLEENDYELVKYQGRLPKNLKRQSVVIVNLSHDSAQNKQDSLTTKFKKIQKVYQELVEAFPDLMAVYTGRHNPVAESERFNRRVRREAEPEPEYTGIIIQSGSVAVLATNIMYKKNSDDTLTNVTKLTSVDVTPPSEDSNVLLLVATFGDVTLTFNFTTGEELWGWSLNFIKLNDIADELIPSTPVEAPRSWSWFCANNVTFAVSPIKGEKSVEIYISGLQAQPNIPDGEELKFGSPIDCVPYFSIAIWTGIAIILLFAFILSWGLTMLMDINTNDRFDDPKGKTITISATD